MPWPLSLHAKGLIQNAESSKTIITGVVRDAVTDEPISKAWVAVVNQTVKAETDVEGRFRFSVPFVAQVQLQAGTVGYAMVKQAVQLLEGQENEVLIRLSPEASLGRSDKVTVTASSFEPVESGAVLERTLNYSELKNMAGVLIDDPLRSVQGLPGVATGDDFNAQFSVRGGAFRNIGLYLDGVLAYLPFHSVHNIQDGGSLTILNGDLVESVSLLNSAAPARFGDRTSAVLSVYTRPGSSDHWLNRAAVGITGVSLTSEGPLNKNRKTTGLLSARKSYTDYVVNRIAQDTNYVIGLWDLQGKLSWQPQEGHQFFLTALWGNSGLNREHWIDKLGLNSLLRGENKSGIVNGQWIWTPSHSMVLQTQTYLTDDQGKNRNRDQEILYRNHHRQYAVGSDLAWEWRSGQRLEIGGQGRWLSESGLERTYDYAQNRFLAQQNYSGHGAQPSAYGQSSWSLGGKRLSITAGMRLDHFTFTGENAVLPRLGANVSITHRLGLSLGFGQYAQYPAWSFLLGEFQNPQLKAERSAHYVAGLEYQLGERIRLRIDAYEIKEHRGIFTPGTEYRVLAGKILSPRKDAVWYNSLRGRSRGAEFLLQRRSANRLSGWLSYSYGSTRLHDDRNGLAFPMDFDQRHTLNLYGSYRIRQTVNLSTKYRYGSNFPIVGFFRTQNGRFYLAENRNQLQTPAYSRLDFRLNKAFFYRRWKLTLYFEVVNLLNRENYRYTGIDRVYLNTGQVNLQRNTLFPILPTAGLLFEF